MCTVQYHAGNDPYTKHTTRSLIRSITRSPKHERVKCIFLQTAQEYLVLTNMPINTPKSRNPKIVELIMRQLAPNCLFRKRCSLVSLAESLGCSQRCIQVAPPRRTNVGAAFLQNYSRRGKREMALFFATKSRPQACCSQLQFPPEILIDDVREEG